MFLHKHPYPPFIHEHTTKLIVGTLPPPRFSQGEFKAGDVDFCYGSIDGQLWPILNTIFNLGLKFETTESAIQERKAFLNSRNIGVCDIVELCYRDKIDASDLGMQDVKLRDLVGYLKQYPRIDTLLFTGGNSKNGPEYLFRKHLKENNLSLKLISGEVPRIHQFLMDNRIIKTVSLTAPSGAANRAVGSMDLYKQLKQSNPKFTTFDFRVMQYSEFF
ncbi:uracil-DNA glycosylase family protein [Formosa sp. S-31]|uniref:uracil-DNA glycosylase family protein n=1 Tax=Formosa sp. S-31 TaxID=2790949 RepID=UPI003EBE21C0